MNDRNGERQQGDWQCVIGTNTIIQYNMSHISGRAMGCRQKNRSKQDYETRPGANDYTIMIMILLYDKCLIRIWLQTKMKNDSHGCNALSSFMGNENCPDSR